MRIIETPDSNELALFVSGEEYGTLLLALEHLKERIISLELMGTDMSELKNQAEPMRALMTDKLVSGLAKEAAERASKTDG